MGIAVGAYCIRRNDGNVHRAIMAIMDNPEGGANLVFAAMQAMVFGDTIASH